ncbi:MAG: hypothetical protein KGZ82_13245 [Bacteroidales bacterium]|nr:hypothetical protein [Bacteroidales bacterium]
MKVIVIGAVGTTALTIKLLYKHNFKIVGVLGHEPLNKRRVSGLSDLRSICNELNIDYLAFHKINDQQVFKWAKAKKPDTIFAVGFSQLLNKEWLTLAPQGCIGFHPTNLPKGRGRAPVAWLILEENIAAANFFQMKEGTDDGPLYIQETFEITHQDDAETLVQKLYKAIEVALDKWLPLFKNGTSLTINQDEAQATYYGKREPCDSLINWDKNAFEIDRLIKASTHPHAGAFTFCREKIVIIWKSKINKTYKYKGVVGRVLLIENNSLLVQCGDNTSLWIDKFDYEDRDYTIKIGDKFGNLHQNQLDSLINNFVWKKNGN